jgi:hypothetical protein
MRKPNPENIYIARRVGRSNRMVGQERMDELDAEHLMSVWEREAESRGLDRYSAQFWDEAEGLVRGSAKEVAPGRRRSGWPGL